MSHILSRQTESHSSQTAAKVASAKHNGMMLHRRVSYLAVQACMEGTGERSRGQLKSWKVKLEPLEGFGSLILFFLLDFTFFCVH